MKSGFEKNLTKISGSFFNRRDKITSFSLGSYLKNKKITKNGIYSHKCSLIYIGKAIFYKWKKSVKRYCIFKKDVL